MIYVDLKGRLGNQMFIYAFAYALSRENNDEPIQFMNGGRNGNSLYNYNIKNVVGEQKFPMSFWQKVLMYDYSKKEMKFNRMDFYDYEKAHMKSYQKNGLFLCQNGFLPYDRTQSAQKNIYVNGYFQSEKYFKKYKQELINVFTPVEPVDESNCEIWNTISTDSNSVCVDFRLGDYINNPLHGVCTLEYYRKAMEYVSDKITNPIFYIFTTDVDYIRTQLVNWPYKMVIEDGKSADYEKLRMMSSCKHFIITNSTYDWWAQYLCLNPDKIVVAPSKWYAKECPCDIYMDDWKLIDC